MQFSKRATLCLLLLTVLISLAVRYPLVEHERYQADSYFIHMLSSSIQDEGYARWIFNPLSYFGYFPLSYPSGVPFLFAETSTLTGVNVDLTILLSGMLFGVLFALCVFILARQFGLRIEMCLIAAFVASVGPRFIDTTYWVGSARGLMAVMMVLTITILLKAGATRRLNFTLFAVPFVIVCLTIHHMAVLFVLFGISYVIAHVGNARLLSQVPEKRFRHVAAYLGFVAAAAIAGSAVVYSLVGQSPWAFLSDSTGATGGASLLSTLGSVVIAYSVQVGIAFPFALLSVMLILRRRNVTLGEIFLITTIVSFIPISGKLLYVSIVLLPFMAVLSARAIYLLTLFRPARFRHAGVIAVLLVVGAAVVLQGVAVDRWNSSTYVSGDTVMVDHAVFNDAAYINDLCAGEYALSNSKTLSTKLAALTDTRLMMPGIYSAVIVDVTKSDVDGNVTWSEASFPVNLYVWFRYDQESVTSYSIYGLLAYGVDYARVSANTDPAIQNYILNHTHLCVVIDNQWPDAYVTEYGSVDSGFVKEVDQSESRNWMSTDLAYDLASYLVYRSELVSVYSVQILPS